MSQSVESQPTVLTLEEAVAHVWHTAACDYEGGHPTCPGCMILCTIAAYEERGREIERLREIALTDRAHELTCRGGGEKWDCPFGCEYSRTKKAIEEARR